MAESAVEKNESPNKLGTRNSPGLFFRVSLHHFVITHLVCFVSHIVSPLSFAQQFQAHSPCPSAVPISKSRKSGVCIPHSAEFELMLTLGFM